jgi:hypothetical protein
VFVTLFADGMLPAGILLANSISQDGHGSLPLLAVSRGDFVRVKVVNSLAALVLGGVALLLFG